MSGTRVVVKVLLKPTGFTASQPAEKIEFIAIDETGNGRNVAERVLRDIIVHSLRDIDTDDWNGASVVVHIEIGNDVHNFTGVSDSMPKALAEGLLDDAREWVNA